MGAGLIFGNGVADDLRTRLCDFSMLLSFVCFVDAS